MNPLIDREKPTLLYVDDEPENLQSFQALFRRDFDIRLAASAQEALEILRAEEIHVLVTDQRMPEISGAELLERVADEYPEVLRYMLTGYSDYDPLVEAINKGQVQGYFSKPLNPKEFFERVGRGLEVCLLKERNATLFNELQQSQAMLKQAHELAHIGIWSWNRDADAVEWSDELWRMTGRTPGGAPLSFAQLLSLFSAASQEKLQRVVGEAVHSGAAYQVELEMILPDHSVRWLHAFGGPTRNDQGDITGLHGTVQDITRQKEAEIALRQAMHAEEAANRAKSEFLGNMSHELRTPLSGIMGVLQLMQSWCSEDKQSRYVSLAINSADRLTHLLTDILVLCDIDSGSEGPRADTFAVRELCAAMTDMFALTAREKGITLDCAVEADMPGVIVGDQTRMRHILFNLVANALKYTEQGAVRLTASWQPGQKSGQGRIHFCVSDTGIGIPQDKLETMFQPFVQLESSYSRKYQGAGLGLTVVRRLVDLLGGDIRLESVPEQGTAAYVDLPCALPRAKRS